MQVLIRKLSQRLFEKPSYVHKWRAERMRAMVSRLNLPNFARVVDLGGSEFMWKLFPHDYHVTLVNLPGFNPATSDPSRFDSIEGDACDLGEVFRDDSFDLAFSNSTIEHVGDETKQRKFAEEVRRLGKAYWVQTPSSRFPIEVHTGVPYYWRLPDSARRSLMRKWERSLPGWAEMIKETRIVGEERLREFFPDGEIYRERRFGFEKSYAMYRPYPRAA